MTKRTLTLFLLLAATASAQVSRPVSHINDVTDLDPYRDAFSIWQGDTVRYDIYARNVRTALVLTGDVFAVWTVSAWTNYGQIYFASTGSVVTATNGHVRVTATQSQTLLPASNYWSQVRLFRVVDATTQEVGMVASSVMAVNPSLDVQASEYVTPQTSAWTIVVNITNNYGDITGGNITNIIAGTNISIRAGGGPQVTVDFDSTGMATGTPLYSVDLSGYATGTPLYAYSESDPVWTAASGAVWSAIDGKQPAGSYATGTPLYVESYTGTGDFHTAIFSGGTTSKYLAGDGSLQDFPAGAVAADLTALSNGVANNAAGVAAVGAVATNAALAAGAAGVDSTQALVRVQGLGADLTNRFTAGYTVPAWNGANITNLAGGGTTYPPTNAATPLTINVANSTTATVTRAPGMHHVRINLTNAMTYAGPLAGGWSDGEAGNVLVWFYGTGAVSGAGISLTNMAGKLMTTNSVGAVWSKPPAGAWENLPLK